MSEGWKVAHNSTEVAKYIYGQMSDHRDHEEFLRRFRKWANQKYGKEISTAQLTEIIDIGDEVQSEYEKFLITQGGFRKKR